MKEKLIELLKGIIDLKEDGWEVCEEMFNCSHKCATCPFINNHNLNNLIRELED